MKYVELYDIIKFVKENNGFYDVFKNWSELDLIEAIQAATVNDAFIVSLTEDQRDINGIALGLPSPDCKVMHVQGIITTEKPVIAKFIEWFREQYPGWQLQGLRDGDLTYYNQVAQDRILNQVNFNYSKDAI